MPDPKAENAPADHSATAIAADATPVSAARVEASHSPEPAEAAPTLPAGEAEIAPLPQRTFGLRRALEAHRREGALGDIPEFPEHRESSEPTILSPAAASVVEAHNSIPPRLDQEPKSESKLARKGVFGFWKKTTSEPVRSEPKFDPAETDATAESSGQAILMPPPPAAAVARKAEREAQTVVDLAPVREAMQVAAEKRAQEAQNESPSADVSVTENDRPVALPVERGRVGVLLINLGTPEAPTAQAVRRYLREFLSDRRVIEKDTLVWQLVLNGIILPLRPRIKAHAYRSIWNKTDNESPLKTVTRSQAVKLGEALDESHAATLVDWAMRYGHPSIESRLRTLIAQGCERILAIPLYPQYSSATTATACDEIFRVLGRLRHQPAVRVAPPYFDEPVYIEAVAASIESELAALSFSPEVILASFHGMPLEYVQKGDPYYQHCVVTTKLLRERLGMNEQKLMLTFQSRFGRTEWLRPYTDQTLRKLAHDGVKDAAVVTPGFSADCLETLEEIAIENARAFKKKGGVNFAFVPCLNDSERGMSVIRDIASRELKGWI